MYNPPYFLKKYNGIDVHVSVKDRSNQINNLTIQAN